MRLTLSLVLLFLSGAIACAVAPDNPRLDAAPDDLKIYGGLPKPIAAPSPAQIERKTNDTPTAKCANGKYSFSRNTNFVCVNHGGVVNWLYQSETVIKADDPTRLKYYED